MEGQEDSWMAAWLAGQLAVGVQSWMSEEGGGVQPRGQQPDGPT